MHRFPIAPFIAPRRRAARLLPLLVSGCALSCAQAQAQAAQQIVMPSAAQSPTASPVVEAGVATPARATETESTAPATALAPASTANANASTAPMLSSARIAVASKIAAPAPLNAGVRLAQLTPNEPNQPAATPRDPANPRGLGVPVGPETPLPSGPAAPPPADTTAPTPPDVTAPEGGSILDTTPDQQPLIGDINAAEGREIADVRVVGNRVVPADTILGQVRLQRGAAFSSNQAINDRARVFQLGFFAAVQVQVTPDLTDPNRIDVTYIVVENRVITGFRFANNTALKADEILPVLTSKIGTVLNRATVAADVQAIQKLYQDKGFAVLVQSAQQADDGILTFTLQEATISKILVTGLKKTQERLVRRQIRIKPGDKFNAAKLRLDLNRLYDTSFFDAVDPKVEDDPDNLGQVIVTFVIREKRTGQFSVGLGFDSRSKISGFLTLGESNLRGLGQRAYASVEVGSVRTFEVGTGNPFIGPKNASYDVSIYRRSFFREPNLVTQLINAGNGNTGGNTGTGNTGTVSNGGTILDNSQAYTYEEQRTGGRINFTQPLDYDRRQTLIFGYRNERAQLRGRNRIGQDVAIVTRNGETLNSRGTVSAASVGFLHDSRDLRIEPSSGGRESIVLEQALKFLGNTTFTKLDLDVRRYISLIRAEKLGAPAKLVLAGRAVYGRSINQLPPFEQYYVGGTDTVRGYQSDIQFGDNQFYANAELRYRFQPRITGVLFADTGAAYGGNFTSNRNLSLLSSIGVGVRLVSPIGPIRLDYGFGRNGGRTHFGIGSTF